MTTKTKAPPVPWVSGFCNPTLPRTGRYDPHGRCSGCACPCHTEETPMLDATLTEFAGTLPEPEDCGTAEPETPDPLAGLDLGGAIELVQAAADRLNTTAGGPGGIAALDWVDAVKHLDALRTATQLLGQMDAELVRHIYLHGEHGKQVIDGVGEVWVARSRAGEKWDERGVARAVIDARMDDRGGEVPDDPWEVAEWLLEVYGIGYCRKTPLRGLGLDPSMFSESTPGKINVTLPPRT